MPELVDPNTSSSRPCRCGIAKIGDLYKIVGERGEEIASGIVGSIIYRNDWTIERIVCESGAVHPVPPGSCVHGIIEPPHEHRPAVGYSVSLAGSGNTLQLGFASSL